MSELKQILANEEHFGSKAPVRRQRIFHLGRELKSGGRSLCNLGLGKFNNRILHLNIRPAVDGADETAEGEIDSSTQEEGSAAVGARKRGRAASPPTQQQNCRQRHAGNTSGADGINEARRNGGNDNAFSTGRPPVVPGSNRSMANNVAIDLVDSSDEDEVEVIEITDL